MRDEDETPAPTSTGAARPSPGDAPKRPKRAWPTRASEALSLSAMAGLAALTVLAAGSASRGSSGSDVTGLGAASLPIHAKKVTTVDVFVRRTARAEEAPPPGRDEPAAPAMVEVAERDAKPETKSDVKATPPPPQRPSSTQPAAKGQLEAEATPVPQNWSEKEIADARVQCEKLLASATLEYEVQEPIRSGQCGAPAPIAVRSLGKGGVALKPAITTNCETAAALNDWVDRLLQPAAVELLGSPVASLLTASSYQCRNRNNAATGPISEHAFANAIDIVALVLKDGRTISVLDHWGPVARDTPPTEAQAPEAAAANAADSSAKKTTASDPKARRADTGKAAKIKTARIAITRKAAAAEADEAALLPEARFLRRVHFEACGPFTTVLGPEANDAHRNHFHFDMKRRRGRAYCQ